MSPTANNRIDYKTVLAERNAALNTTAMPTVTLASGHTMPVVAYGTFRASPGESYESVLAALHVGYRHFDLAHVYGNEHEIGTAFASAFSNNIVQRSDLFITGKLWNSDHDVNIVPQACQHSLRNLQLFYFDLYLIHFPVAWKHTGLATPSWGKSEFGDTPLIDTWRAMEKLVDNGTCRSIGVSNYPLLLLQDLVTQARIPVSCNQIETHVYYTRRSLVNYCLSRNICVTAHTPLGGGKANEDYDPTYVSPLQNSVVNAIAASKKANGATPATILLRFLLQSGIVVLPKSVKVSRMKENINLFGTAMALSAEEMTQLSKLDKYKSYKTNPNPINAVLGGPDAFTTDGTDIFD